MIDLSAAARQYLESVRSGNSNLIETGIPDLDYAIGGGIERGELVVIAARPSHGKSAVALQMAHSWTLLGMPTVIISEEMSALAFGKRTLQFVSDVAQEHWRTSAKRSSARSTRTRSSTRDASSWNHVKPSRWHASRPSE